MNKNKPSLLHSPARQWQELQARVEAHAERTGIPFHLWLLQVQKNLQVPSLTIADSTTDLHRAFREELLS